MPPSLETQFYIFTYDISDSKRLRKVFKTLMGYGMHRQLSVFICELSPKKKILLVRKLSEIIDPQCDQVMFVPLCQRCVADLKALGQPIEPIDQNCIIL